MIEAEAISAAQNVDLRRRLQDLERLLEEMHSIADPSLRDQIAAIVGGVLEFHGAGLAHMIDAITQEPAIGPTLIGRFADDELIGSLLLLHGLHPQDLKTRLHRALEQVRPMLHSHGGDVEVIEIDRQGAVRLRLHGSCHGCPSSQQTLHNAIEKAIYAAAPDVTAIHLDQSAALRGPGASPAVIAGFVPLSALTTSNGTQRNKEHAT